MSQEKPKPQEIKQQSSEPVKKAFVAQPLVESQIDKAYEIIKENHPLNDTPFSSVFPILKPIQPLLDKISKKQQPNKEEEEKGLLDQEKGQDKKESSGLTSKKVPQLKAVGNEASQDSFNFLGFGMVAYRDLMFLFILMFILLSALMIPAMYFYKQGGAITNPKKYEIYSLGNLGYSSAQCMITPFDFNKAAMLCPYGQITKVDYLGINPKGMKNKDSCAPTAESKICNDQINPDFMTKINNQISSTNKTNDFALSFTSNDIFKNESTIPAACNTNSSYLYIQYECTQSAEQISTKFNRTSYITAIGLFIAFLFSIIIYYFKKDSKLKQLEWDIQTITPGDYTMQYEITDKAYKWFVDNVYQQDKARGLSLGESMKTYLKSQLEKSLTDKLIELKKDSEKSKSISIREVKIADIVFAFDNAELINLLRERGGHIMNQRYDQMREVEKKISELKDTQFEKITKPVDAFITFEEEDGQIVSQEFEQKHDESGKPLPALRELMGDDLFLVESTEPTNIIWENRHFTTRDYIKRTAIAIAVIILLLLASFSVMFYFKQIALDLTTKYPSVNCEDVKKVYNNNSMEKYAYREFMAYYEPQDNSNPTPLQGVLSCHCDSEKAAGVDLTEYETGNENGQIKRKICEEYKYDTDMASLINSGVSYLIVGVNFVLRNIIIALIKFIGKDTESEQTRLITNGVFVVQFFNTGFLLLLVNANLAEQWATFSAIFNRKLPDFNQLWYQDIGQTIISTMIVNTYWPVIEFFMYVSWRAFKRLWDRTFTMNTKKTKKSTIQQYVELYSGPTFAIHYKYSSILNITFVTMMYGLGLPVLFPIAAISILVLYILEKILINYSYRLPPSYDEKLNTNVLSILQYAPLFGLIFGYWMFSNKQLLANNVYLMESSTSVRKTGHVWIDLFTPSGYQLGPALPLIIGFWALLLILLLKGFIYKILFRLFPSFIKVGELEIDENLANYFKTIDDHDRNWSLKEESYARKTLNMKILDDYTYDQLKSYQAEGKTIQGVHCYDILANPLYLDDFQYFSPSMDNRNDYIIDDDEDEGNDNAQSDLVKIILNLGFLTEKKAKEFQFNKSSYRSQLNNEPSAVRK